MVKENIKKKSIIILGSKGMLGNQAAKYFKKNFTVKKFNKKFTALNVNNYIKNLNNEKPSIILNCIGKIKQKKSTIKELYWSNTLLINKFASQLSNKHLLIHPSTDCVFNGSSKIRYKKSAKLDSTDDYGVSKILAEKILKKRKNTLIIRTSIVGLEKNSKNGLLSWFLSEKNKTYGYVDHFWNGVTTLKWCELIENYLTKINYLNLKNSKIIQIGTKKNYTKYEMLKIFKNVFKKKILIKKKKVGYINRCLNSDFKIENLEIQLQNLKKFHKI